MMKILITPFFLLLSLQGFAQQAEPSESPLKRADMISAKANLEETLVRRYTQELSALVDMNHFSVGANFELGLASEFKPAKAEGDVFTDLELTYLDADALFESYAIPESVSPLERYIVKSVTVNAGLQADLGDETKENVEKWLAARVSGEFGKIGKVQVQFIKSPGMNTSTIVNWIKDLQGLVGSLVLALAILLGVILWSLLGGSKSESESQGASVNIDNKSEIRTEDPFKNIGSAQAEPAGLSAAEQISQYSDKIKSLVPQIDDHVEDLISEWCDQGESGLNRLACFAEISGSILGALPIPADFKKQMGDVFSNMHGMNDEKRLDIIESVYWDTVATVNLGTDSLHRPFSFINNSSMSTVNKVLLGNDVDTQTVVTLFMPDSMRKQYMADLELEKKVEILEKASHLSEISEHNLKSIEENIAPYFEDKAVAEDQVSMSLTLTKLIDSLSFTDSCSILPSLSGNVINAYKVKHAHLAFLSQWSNDALEYVAKKSSNEELVAYLRVVPDMKFKILEFVTPRVKQIIEDDLEQEDKSSFDAKEAMLASFNSRLVELVANGDVLLERAIHIDETTGDIKLAA